MTLNVCFWKPSSGTMHVDLNQRLHWRGGDFRVFANTGYEPANQPKTLEEHLGRIALSRAVEIDQRVISPDGWLLQELLAALLRDDTGVVSILVTPYQLVIQHSMATPATNIKELVLTTLREMGFEPVEVDQHGQPITTPEPVGWQRVKRALKRLFTS